MVGVKRLIQETRNVGIVACSPDSPGVVPQGLCQFTKSASGDCIQSKDTESAVQPVQPTDAESPIEDSKTDLSSLPTGGKS